VASITRRRAIHAERREEHAAAVLTAARGLLAEGVGFTELTVQRIAAAAGISRPAFYMHFRDKIEVLLRLAGELRQRNFPVTSSWTDDDDAGVEALVGTYERVISIYRENAPVIAAITEVAAYDATVREFWDREVSAFTAAAEARLIRDRAAGRTAAGLDPAAAASLMVRGGDQVIRYQIAHGHRDDDAGFAREFALSHWYGFFRRPS
jgi:AcrR family transcriptional regulator